MKRKNLKIYLTIILILISANTAFAAGDGQGHAGISSLTWYFINFFVFFAFLFYIAKNKFTAFVSKRSEEFETALNKGKLELEVANEKLREVDARIAKLPQDLEALKFEYQNLLNGRISEIEESTEKDLARMEEQATSMIEAEKKKMEKNLMEQLSEHIVNQAKERLGDVSSTDKDRRKATFKAYASLIK